MKKVFSLGLLCAIVFLFTQAQAQTTKKDDDSFGHKVGKTATKVGHKTAQIAATGAAAITDKRYDEKAGPHGEAIYINKHSHYFYVNKRGHRVYLKKSQLHDKDKS